ncbi:16S rRNA G966 N2-methylase RsmD [Mycolicibacterium sp. BK556]|nr:16S rRNA G966 N2-methylase RsmD [Mycolicibacterium sp. BK556]MBB3634463.1 16S rRNA G966 N2-methylase RsmD [Mycolicibacterium sp. BK607]MBB3752040.1 16S rRNA G966 N2-methylase RsmD [Mycolicibacterium sp. BK634]
MRRGAVAAVLAAGSDKPVDLVLADPPYEVSTADIEVMLDSLVRNGWLGADSIVVVERPVSAAEIGWPAGWTAWPDRRYGDTRVELATC